MVDVKKKTYNQRDPDKHFLPPRTDISWEKADKDGHTKCIIQLMQAGADVNALYRRGSSALIKLVDSDTQNSEQILKELLSVGADVNKNDSDDLNALCKAPVNGHDKFVKM